MLFIFLALMSVPAMLMTWMGGTTVMHHVEWLETENVFFVGLAILLFAWGLGLLALISARFIAECLFAFFSMAHNLSILRKKQFPMDSGTVVRDQSVESG